MYQLKVATLRKPRANANCRSWKRPGRTCRWFICCSNDENWIFSEVEKKSILILKNFAFTIDVGVQLSAIWSHELNYLIVWRKKRGCATTFISTWLVICILALFFHLPYTKKTFKTDDDIIKRTASKLIDATLSTNEFLFRCIKTPIFERL